MHILQIANDYLGSRLYTLLFAALEKKGHTHTVFVPMKYGTDASQPKERVHVVPCFNDLDRVLFYRKQNTMLRWMEGNLNFKDFDLIHAHTVFSGGYAALQLHKRYGIPYIVAVRDTDVNVFFKYMVHLRKVGVEIMANAAQVIFLSPAYQKKVLERCIPDSYRQVIAQKSRVIPNGINALFLEQAVSPRTAIHDPLRLIYVGLLNSRKNPELTIEAVKRLRSQGKNVTLTVVGAIKEEKYRKLLESADFVTYHDRCPQEQVIAHLQEADMFVMPSHTETFGLVYAEAMSQGLPVLYTAGQGFDGHFPEGEVGFSVSDTDAGDLAEKILKVTAHYEILSKNAIARARRFDWDTIAQEYHELYREICR